jgi:hypothetical protein
MIYYVKHDGRHKARLVSGGHSADPNTESVYSGVVSLRGIRLIEFLAELKNYSYGEQMLVLPTLKKQPRRRYI